MLPNTIEEYASAVKAAPKEPKLVQIPSLTPRHMCEVAPAFIFPGITGGKEACELAQKLMAPTYYVELPSALVSIKDAAAEIAKVSQ